ncbi:peroxisomal targeting signal 2 receptor-like [Pecten maximus]|uniref:peroxisomal targeting signal 2 receptor-like n=1 Tax=Pecten maximus TaxID=6579 RepID=UPI001458AB45|nr:peroxisomal targeting signal 2 receptor-like [Pecten maximus]
MNVSFQTKSRHGYSVEFSPYYPNRLACATSQYYGLAGCGTLFVLDTTPNGLVPLRVYQWNDGLFEVTWSEDNDNVLVTAAGDGSVLLWDVSHPQGPLKALKEHTKETYSVHWSQTRNENFVISGSWDSLIKLWDISQPNSLATFSGHRSMVYSVRWSPHIPGCFASASGDQTLCVWDVRKPQFAQTVIPAHEGEVLSCDWCKYDQNMLFSGSVDGTIRVWDIRNPQTPLNQLLGHKLAVRRVKASPHSGNILASCSYDFTTRVWDMTGPAALEVIEHHTEFVYGLDFNLHIPGQIADCGWDEMVHVFSPRTLKP